ncbi:hypothetical protein [Nocardiopsis nanhaiensis]
MITAAPGYVARFKNDNGRTTHSTPVLAWEAGGAALILDPKRGELARARDTPGFDRVEQDLEFPIVAAVPGQGWRAEYTDDEYGPSIAPVLAWTINHTGLTEPVVLDAEGSHMPESSISKLVPPDDGDPCSMESQELNDAVSQTLSATKPTLTSVPDPDEDLVDAVVAKLLPLLVHKARTDGDPGEAS